MFTEMNAPLAQDFSRNANFVGASTGLPRAAFQTAHTAQSPAAGGLAEPLTFRFPGYYPACKVALDFCVALALLVLSAPVILACWALVRLTSRGPGIYCQTRLGLGGRKYVIYKIRTMYDNCEARGGARWSAPGDTRVTPVGRFLRRTHLDELPQLWNVLRGDMSLVGPRPERPEFEPKLTAAMPNYRERLLVRPGLTGLAQLQLPPDTSVECVRRKLACDLMYIRHLSLSLDFRLLIATAGHLVRVPSALTLAVLCLPTFKADR